MVLGRLNARGLVRPNRARQPQRTSRLRAFLSQCSISEDFFDFAIANSIHSGMQIYCRIAVLHPYFKLLSNFDVRR